MRNIKNPVKIILFSIAIIICVLDSQTTFQGAFDGVMLCIKRIIPSMFPMMLLSSLLCQSIVGQQIPALEYVWRYLHIPKGMESVLLISFLGGYPVGAQNIYSIYSNRLIDRYTAQKLLCFFNNAGPAFIFGMIGMLFKDKSIGFVLWGVHIMAALIIARITQTESTQISVKPIKEHLPFTAYMNKTVQAMVNICGWVIIFHIIIHFLQKWFLWALPQELSIYIIGMLDLANGADMLAQHASAGFRFILAAGILGFGGICVIMQTIFVTKELGLGNYVPSKILHSAISMFFCALLQNLLFKEQEQFHISVAYYVIRLAIIVITTIYIRKNSSILRETVV